MRLRNNARHAQTGFTLIELLVVIAIIAILAAILFPVFARARERGRTAMCLSNLRQLSLAVRTYVDDHQGRMFNIGVYHDAKNPNWCGSSDTFRPVYPEKGSLWPYVKSAKVYLCPSDKNKPASQINGSLAEKKGFALSYSVNDDLHYQKFDSCLSGRDPARVMLMIHERRNDEGEYRGTINDGLYLWLNRPGRTLHTNDTPGGVHTDGTTLVYCDGHAARLSTEQLIQDQKNFVWEVNWVQP